MIIALVIMLVVGLVTGGVSDELLRGRDPRATGVVGAGLVGAIAGLVLQRMSENDGLLVGALSAFVGALVLAFVVRIRLSAAIARLSH
jgi:uncharacterized membrane protein YeaQ/YmgE (transglycosylase-associated protein family)